MTDRPLTDERLFALIAAYGADPLAFPGDVRQAAAMRLAAAPDLFSAALADARDMDAALSVLPVIEPSADLMARLMDTAPQADVPKPSILMRLRDWILPEGRWGPAAGALASLGVGLVMGGVIGMPQQASGPADEDTAIYTALGLTDYDSLYDYGDLLE